MTVRGFFLNQPMRYDEAYTFLTFVNQSLGHLFYYPLPNNHVFHTLLVRVSVEIFGSHPFTIRLPALIAGLINIPLTFVLAKRLTGHELSGYFAATGMAVMPFVILFDTSARGYSLLVLLTLVLALLVHQLTLRNSNLHLVSAAIVSALGLWVMPTFLFPLGGLYLWFLLRQKRVSWAVLIWPMLTGLITVVLYTPVVIASGGIESIIANRFVASLSFSDWITRLPGHLVQSADSLTRGAGAFVTTLFTMVLIGGAIASRWYSELRLSYGLLLSFALVSLVLMFVQRVIPFDRTWIFFLPALLIALDATLSNFLGHLTRQWQLIYKASCLAAAVIVGSALVRTDAIAKYPDTGTFPEAATLAAVLLEHKSADDYWVATTPAVWPTAFYLWYFGDKQGFMPKMLTENSKGQQFLVIKPSRYGVGRFTNEQTQKILQLDDAELHVAE